jgi:ribosomal protein L5
MPRLYKKQLRSQESLETAVRKVGVSCETVASKKDMNTEAEESTMLKAITTQQPVKIQQTEKTSYVL